MSLRASLRRALLPALCMALVAPAVAQRLDGELAPGSTEERALEQYLAERGLLEPLALHLRDRLESAPGSERVEIAERLARVYVELLGRAETGEQRSRWERLGRELLAQVPKAESIDLRLDLHRAAYARAEQIAERWRVGMASAEEREEAITTFKSLERDLAVIGQDADRRVIRLQRQEEEGRGADDLLSKHLGDARRQRSLSFYLAGWCNTYLADMTGAAPRAEEALRQFGWLLGAKTGDPASLRRLPRAFLRYEHVARSALGVAASNAMLGRDGEALAWLEAVETAENLPDALGAQAPVWRMVILAELRRWSELDELVRRRRAGEGRESPTLPVGEARLLATLTLRADAPSGEGATLHRLRDAAVADLVRQGELAGVVDLARSHGAQAFGETGFIAHSVRGLLAHERARRAEGGDAAGADNALLLYDQASRSFETALEAPDSQSFLAAAGEVAMTLGLSRFAAARLADSERATRLLSAAEAFERATSMLREPRAGEAIWMAMRALDEASSEGVAIDERRRDELVEAYLEGDPDSQRAGALLLNEAVSSDAPTEEIIARLERIPPGAEAYESARRHIARLLYEQFRDAGADRRDWAALRYADAAEPLLESDLRAALAGDEGAASSAAARARRLAAAALAADPPDASRAQRAMDALERLIDAGLIDEAPIEREMRYRAAQVAVARGDLDGARATLDRLREAAGAGDEQAEALASSLAMSIYRGAAATWRDAQRSEEGLAEAARRVAAVGADLLDHLPDGQTRLAVAAGVAEAHHDIWLASREEEALEAALERHIALEEQGVTDPAFLRRLAELAEAAGEVDRAVGAWRTLATGLAPPDGAWFEARWRMLRLIASEEPARARSLLEQHATLYPQYGPAPWGERLAGLHDRLRAEGESGEGAP